MEELTGLDELKAQLNERAEKSGDDFVKALQERFPEKEAQLLDMRFSPADTTFEDTFAGLGAYCHTVDICYREKVYKTVFIQDKGMSIRKLPDAVTDLAWRNLLELKGLMDSIQRNSSDDLSERLKRALPDEFRASLDDNTIECKLVDAIPGELGKYRFEIKIKAPSIRIEELGMEISDFKVTLG